MKKINKEIIVQCLTKEMAFNKADWKKRIYVGDPKIWDKGLLVVVIIVILLVVNTQ